MTVTHRRSRSAITEYRVVDRFKLYDLLEINLRTGRTHQIRVHMSYIGHPIFNDSWYGGDIILVDLELAGIHTDVKFNVSDRTHMKYPILIGRNLLRKGFLVDCSNEDRDN